MQYHNRTDTKALVYTHKREERYLARVSSNSNIYLWICKKGHQWKPRQRRACKEYKAKLEEENYHLRSELQIKINTNCQNKKRLENTSEEEIAEQNSKISSLKSNSISDFLAKLRLYLQNQGVDPADNARGLPTGREIAIGYLRGCIRGRALEWFDEEITTKQN
ncbi:18006_t:CDS:2 [Funneliformis geosporum]|uniref:18006_t:CDS:1 n=1 Tax=Funneliformis geosporum TaxID=1117311 RepID=A0A9W4WTS0_9GLOM|nr:18006_t:CDS:2 [Funneliformis geosporum]